MARSVNTFRGSYFNFSGHAETILPALFRKVQVPYIRKRFELNDGDFLDVDTVFQGNSRVLLQLHGLEGSSNSTYIKGMARFYQKRGWDIAVLNFRGCSGIPNRLLSSYHSGATQDLEYIVHILLSQGNYRQMALAGFSLGGNVLLKFLGDPGHPKPPEIKAAVAISVPVDLKSSSLQLARPQNRVYMNRFLRSLKQKMLQKNTLFPGKLNLENLEKIRTFTEFDDRFTAPIHGFRDAEEYYRICSSVFYLKNITVPTLLMNARNDPFLAPACFPEQSPMLHTQYPDFGGHTGFSMGFPNGTYWSEIRSEMFIKSAISSQLFE